MSETWDERWPRIRDRLSPADREAFAAKFGDIAIENEKLRADLDEALALLVDAQCYCHGTDGGCAWCVRHDAFLAKHGKGE